MNGNNVWFWIWNFDQTAHKKSIINQSDVTITSFITFSLTKRDIKKQQQQWSSFFLSSKKFHKINFLFLHKFPPPTCQFTDTLELNQDWLYDGETPQKLRKKKLKADLLN